jgi:hypothetical protein
MVIVRRCRISALLLVLLISPRMISADPVEDLLQKVEEAVSGESYTRAVALLEEGKKTYPDDYRLPLKAGRLFMDRELYHLALAEFKAADELNPSSGEVLYAMAEASGYLGRNSEAVSLLEKLNAMDIPDLKDDVIDDLSWMYFKTYRLEDGVALLEKALEGHFNRNWAHTLGTLYSGLYDIEKSRYWYMKSIEDALDNGKEYFASVAYYNLSLLDYSFYLYRDAREEAMRSIEIRPRSGGFMVIGELDFLAWNLDDALSSYREAESRDDTPLSRVDLASFYQRIGYLDEAIRLVENIRDDTDSSWMYHYGVNSMRFEMDLHQILADSWKGKAEQAALVPAAGLKQVSQRLYHRFLWSIRGMYHNRYYRALTSGYSAELQEEGNSLDAAWNAASASRGYRRIALSYLEEARLIETELTTRAVPWYEMEMGREAGDEGMLENALLGFSPEEGAAYEETLRYMAQSSGKYLRELYSLNPGGLRQYGLSLPVVLKVSGERSRFVFRRLRRLLRHSGYRVYSSPGRASGESVLTVSSGKNGRVKMYLSDPEGKTRSSTIDEDGLSWGSLAVSLAELLDQFYQTLPGERNQ